MNCFIIIITLCVPTLLLSCLLDHITVFITFVVVLFFIVTYVIIMFVVDVLLQTLALSFPTGKDVLMLLLLGNFALVIIAGTSILTFVSFVIVASITCR